MNENNEKYDDLTAIKYIGPKMQEWLREKLQVQTYQDLADLSVEDIQTQLSADEKSVAKSNIETWIAQAEKLALEANNENEVEESNLVSAGSSAGEQTPLPKKAGDWKEYASFMVYFEARKLNGEQEKRIKVSHLEADKSAVWTELSADHFLWILEQAGETDILEQSQLAIEKQPVPAIVETSSIEEAKVNVKKIEIFQPPEAKKPLSPGNGTSKPQVIKAGEPFALEVFFSLEGEGAETVVNQHAPYSTSIIASEKHTKSGIDLGSSEPKLLVEETFEYSVRTPEVKLNTGEHQLWSIVSIQAANTVPNFLEGPTVRAI